MKKIFGIVLIIFGTILFLCGVSGCFNGGAETGVTENVSSFINTEDNRYKPTLGESNALRKAKMYLRTMAFSYEGLKNQLLFEGFSETEAAYGVDNCEVDWNEQCVLKAKHYLNTMPFSKNGLITQLEFEKFTMEQIEYAITEIAYN